MPGGAKGDTEELEEYRISLAPGPDILRRGINPLGVFDELRELGATTVSTDFDLVPPLEQIDPERCYLTWTIHVRTNVEPDRIKEVFLFFTEDSSVLIEQQAEDGRWLRVRMDDLAAPASPVSPRGVQLRKEQRKSQRSGAHRRNVCRGGSGDVAAIAGGCLGRRHLSHLPCHRRHRMAQPPLVPSRALHSRIRVDAAQLDDLVGLAGELAVLSDNLMGLREIQGVEPWLHALESLQRVSREIRDTTLDLRMVPVDELFSRFPRVVRDLADRSGKEIELRIVGQETRLDRTIVERLSDPMVHLIRNAVDHALEHPKDRTERGKSRVGRITLWAGHEGDRVAIRVEDDGRGLDCEKIVRKGIALGMIAPGTRR